MFCSNLCGDWQMKKLSLVMLSVMLVLLCALACNGKVSCAQTYYGSIEEMRQSVDWLENYTLGMKQQITVERLSNVEIWDYYVLDESGAICDYLKDYISISADGVLCVDGYEVQSGIYYILCETYEDGLLVDGCIKMTYMAFNQMPMERAVLVESAACDYSICQLGDFPYAITYTSSDEEIAVVDERGMVTPQKKAGDVTITATVMYPEQEPVVFTGELDVTDPKVPKTIVVARKENLTIDIPGTSENSSYYFSNKSGKESFTSKKCYVSAYGDEDYQCLRLSIDAKNKKTKQKVTITVDGRKMTFNILFSNPKFKKEVLVVKKGKTLTLPVTGTKSASVITYNVSDEKIAALNKKGKIKGKKLGSTWVSIDVDGKTFYALLVVQKGKMYKVVKYAADQIGTAKYSQAKRMDKGYYDCSSLVWRSYKAAGYNIGNTTWALNSDGFANYYYKKGKHYVGKNLKSNKKLKCGDIIIRGKYKKGKAQTYHAELYIGDGYIIEAGGYGVHLSTTVGADIAVRPWP